MPQEKLVMEGENGKMFIGYQKGDCDPHCDTREGDVLTLLPGIPEFIAEAEQIWATSPNHPAYKPPKEPKKTTKPAAAAQPAPEKAEDLPLLAQQSQPKPEETAPAKDEEKAEEPAPDQAPQAQEAASTSTEPEPEPKPAEEKPAAPSGQVEYFLEDGRGPYVDIQKAMDAMGMDKDNRPHHNRWDRLSADLKQKIQRKPKA